MPKILEVIVTSLHEAIEAERGGADRLEVVRALAQDGLTPSTDLVRNILQAVKIPVRVMLRENTGMEADAGELTALAGQAESLAALKPDGLVLGFIREGCVDVAAVEQIAAAVPGSRITFHRAFDGVRDPFCAIQRIRQIPQVDRILASGGEGLWAERTSRLVSWQAEAGAALHILTGGGLTPEVLAEVAREPELTEFHVGRAARIPATVWGTVRQGRVAKLKSLLA